eukprot:2352780-Amphidinium_carterae.1
MLESHVSSLPVIATLQSQLSQLLEERDELYGGKFTEEVPACFSARSSVAEKGVGRAYRLVWAVDFVACSTELHRTSFVLKVDLSQEERDPSCWRKSIAASGSLGM